MPVNLNDLLGKTSPELVKIAKTADAETQSTIRFILTKIQDKDHRTLVTFLKNEGSINEIKKPFEEYKKTDVNSLTALITASARKLSIAALIAALFIIQSVAAGDPIRLEFVEPKSQLGIVETDHGVTHNDCIWLSDQIATLTDSRIDLKVSEWAEEKRYLPPQVTSMPGYYDYAVAPFLREIADCMSITSPIREVDFMKAAQIGATVGILENTIGYVVDHVKAAPVMLLTADAELAKLRVESYITPMFQHSDLYHLIRSSDEHNKRKTGKTDKKIEWAGGGFLVPFGAQNADKLRSISIRYLLEDECDAFPQRVGKDGDPQKLAEARTKAYHESRKILRISTPLIKNKSRIDRGFKKGDQRKYFIPCKECGEKQELKFQGVNKETGLVYGLTWEMDDGLLIPESVRYVCKHCGHAHRNADKAWMFPRGEWKATARPTTLDHRSYHINALYSPVGMFPWSAVVLAWLDAWDVDSDSVKNTELLQEFYNNNLGMPFEIMGSKVRFTQVSAHRRADYRLGEMPNKFASQHSGSPILFLTCQVDVHKRNLAVSVMGWTVDMKCYVIDYWRFERAGDEDDCSELSSPVWQRLRELIEDKIYTADDGKIYRIILTLVDAGYANDTVTNFCADYSSGVYPILGRERPAKNQTIKEFAEFTTQSGTIGYRILVDHYKDRLAPVLRREWTEEAGMQKTYHFNAPVDINDKQLKELTVETRREKQDDHGGTTYYWHRPGNARNELWDLLVYGNAAVEILAWSVCIQHFELETIDWPRFWDYIQTNALYYDEKVV